MVSEKIGPIQLDSPAKIVKDVKKIGERYEVLIAGKEQDYSVTIDLKNNFVCCTCPSAIIRKIPCPHIKKAMEECKIEKKMEVKLWG